MTGVGGLRVGLFDELVGGAVGRGLAVGVEEIGVAVGGLCEWGVTVSDPGAVCCGRRGFLGDRWGGRVGLGGLGAAGVL